MVVCNTASGTTYDWVEEYPFDKKKNVRADRIDAFFGENKKIGKLT